MIEYAQLKPGPGFQLDRAVRYYAQRLAIIPAVRRAASSAIAARLRRRHGRGLDQPDGETQRVLSELRREGVSLMSPLLPGVQIEEMAAYFHASPVIGPDGALTSIGALPANTAIAAYDLATVLACPGMLDLLNAPEVLRIASGYIGCKPTLSSVGVRWSFPRAGGAATDIQRFHRDVDDWRFLKLFIYLTDVDERSGPHVYVRTSHRKAFGFQAKAYTMRQIEGRFGADKVMTVTGAAGATFVADTVGVHCGATPIERPRLMLQVQYSVLPVYAFSYRPVARAAKVDAYCNRLLVSNPAREAGVCLAP